MQTDDLRDDFCQIVTTNNNNGCLISLLPSLAELVQAKTTYSEGAGSDQFQGTGHDAKTAGLHTDRTHDRRSHYWYFGFLRDFRLPELHNPGSGFCVRVPELFGLSTCRPPANRIPFLNV